MTKAQATAMNQRFVELTNTNKELDSRATMTDSLLVREHAIALENLMGFGWALDSIKHLKYQLKVSQGALFLQTEKVVTLQKELKKKPAYREMSSTDVWMGSMFMIFGTIISTITLSK